MKKIILLVTASILLISGCSSNQNNKSVNLNKNTASNSSVYIMCGKIASNEKVDVSSKISAKISKLNVDIGTTVKEGDPLVYLDTADLTAQVNQAQAGVDAAKANLAKIESGSRPEQIASAKAEVEGAKEAYDVSQKNYDRQSKLLQGGGTAQINVDEASEALASAKAKYESAEQNLLMIQNGPTQNEVSAAEASVKQAESAEDVAKTQLKNGVITSPISGTVVEKNTSNGQIASPGSPLISIINNSNLYINAYMPSEFLGQIKEGQDVDVKISNIDDKVFHGQISVIDSSVSKQSNNILVKVTLKDTDSRLKIGMFSEIGYKN
ncbi:efflux RND transporter periplasmic adaptor subunit [Clostridium sp. JN-1]|uniref:HlyD family secretion protein n=1 Tax=Clostridium sp. JN-1 TaxID=2483110 RepID=UPI001681979A|nr:efflux RND transporter periplasmic adaptor subunit [Clostridium sp. JN-1]